MYRFFTQNFDDVRHLCLFNGLVFPSSLLDRVRNFAEEITKSRLMLDPVQLKGENSEFCVKRHSPFAHDDRVLMQFRTQEHLVKVVRKLKEHGRMDGSMYNMYRNLPSKRP